MNAIHRGALALCLGLAIPCLADSSPTNLRGSWRLEGQNYRGTYRGTATIEQDAQGNVTARLALAYRKWSWLRFRYVDTGLVETVSIRGRLATVQGYEHLVGHRTAGAAGRVDPFAGPISYRINPRSAFSSDDSPVGSIGGSYAQGDGQGIERLTGHIPTSASRAERDEALGRARAEIERAIAPDRWRLLVREGAGDYVRDAEDLKRELGLPALRASAVVPVEELLDPEKDAELRAFLELHLVGLQGFSIGDPHTLRGEREGGYEHFVLGRNKWGDLVGVRGGR